MAEAGHSTYSASGADRWAVCPGSMVLSQGAPRTTSKYAAEGTAAHLVLTWALQQGKPAAHFIGETIEADGFTFVIDEEMADHVQTTADYVKDLVGEDGTLFVDERVNYASYLGVPEDQAWGTADAIVIRGDEIIVVDFKYGQGVKVSAEHNRQMKLYALGALQAYHGIVNEFKRVRMAISQPRVSSAPSEWDCSVEELEAWGRGEARSAACSVQNAMRDPDMVVAGSAYLNPGEKQCKFCPAKATCPALRNEVARTVFTGEPLSPDEFADLTVPGKAHIQPADPAWLAACLAKADLIEDWCKAVRAEAERRLLDGQAVPGFKLVQGKKGNRQWSDEAAAEEMLKGMRLKVEEMYSLKLITPPAAEKLAPKFKDGKPVPAKDGAPAPLIGPRQWPKLAALIVQKDGAPHVAPASDPRAALDIASKTEDFQPVEPDGSDFA